MLQKCTALKKHFSVTENKLFKFMFVWLFSDKLNFTIKMTS